MGRIALLNCIAWPSSLLVTRERTREKCRHTHASNRHHCAWCSCRRSPEVIQRCCVCTKITAIVSSRLMLAWRRTENAFALAPRCLHKLDSSLYANERISSKQWMPRIHTTGVHIRDTATQIRSEPNKGSGEHWKSIVIGLAKMGPSERCDSALSRKSNRNQFRISCEASLSRLTKNWPQITILLSRRKSIRREAQILTDF